MEVVPKTLDWVKARAECSLEHIFMLLGETVDSDVKGMQARLSSDRIQLDRQEGKLIVTRIKNFGGGITTGSGIVFELSMAAIAVRAIGPRITEPDLFSAKPTITASGECKLMIEGDPQPLELWQVSRKALEGLFFP